MTYFLYSHIFYILNLYVKFYTKYILFIIRSINLFFMYIFENIKFFARKKDVRRKCYSMKDLSKFTFNKTILSEIVFIDCNQVCSPH